MKKIKKYRGLIVSLILAIATVLVIHQYILALENQHEAKAPPVDGEKQVEVVVVAEKLPSGTVLTSEYLETKTVYQGNLHPDAITEKEDALGEVIIQDMVREEVLISQKLLPEEEVNRLSHSIPEDKRALSVSVDEVSGVAGFIQAGDKVDVIASLYEDPYGEERDMETEIILEELKVLAAGERVLYSDQDLVQKVSTVTLAVTPSEGEYLTDADEEGTIRLLLRPLVEEE